MLDLVDTIETAISNVTAFADWRILWRGERGQSLKAQDDTYPVLQVNVNNQIGVQLVTSDGILRVAYEVQIAAKFIPADGTSSEMEKASRAVDKDLRSVVLAIGALQEDGSTNIEIEEDSLTQSSETNSSTKVCESVVTFKVNFDEE